MRLPKLVLDTMRGAAGAALALAIGCGTDASPPIVPETPAAVVVPVSAPPVVAPVPIVPPPPVAPPPADPPPSQAEPEPGTEPDGEEPPQTEEALATNETAPTKATKRRGRRNAASAANSADPVLTGSSTGLDTAFGEVGIGHYNDSVHAGCGRG